MDWYALLHCHKCLIDGLVRLLGQPQRGGGLVGQERGLIQRRARFGRLIGGEHILIAQEIALRVVDGVADGAVGKDLGRDSISHNLCLLSYQKPAPAHRGPAVPERGGGVGQQPVYVR